jgi:DNA-binding CsgD family transcriptional regulator/tetratricopeptide (TPR) repeat protein
MLLGRHDECGRIISLLDATRLGEGGLLVIRGEAGVGKSTLLSFARAQAAGMQVLRGTGIAGESEIAFAGLLDLVRPALGYLPELPPARAEALRGALGLIPGVERDRFAIGAATLSLLAAVAERSPVLIAVDDVQWLDTASLDALLFAAHRLTSDPVAVILTERDGESSLAEVTGPSLVALAGLDRQATTLLAEAGTGSPLSSDQAKRLYRLTRGNPLAVTEFGDHDSSGEPIDAPIPISAALEAGFARRASQLTTAGQAALLVLAADDSGETATVRRAAGRLGLTDADLEEAETAGLVLLGDGRIEFRHPLVRSAVYQRAAAPERRAAHRAIADSLRGDWQASRRAWHRAAAATDPDEAVAAALDAAAHEARSRTGYAAAARAYERAASLTPDDESRAHREFAAADAYWQIGRWQRAIELLDAAQERSSDALVRADVQLLRGRIADFRGETAGLHALLLDEAVRVAPLDARRAAMLAGAAVDSAFNADHATLLATAAVAVRLVQSEALALDARATPWLCSALLAIGEQVEARRFVERLRAELDATSGAEDDLYTRVSVAIAYGWLGEFALARHLATRALSAAREQGALSLVAYACGTLSALHVAVGNFDTAAAFAEETRTIGRDTGQRGVELHGVWYLCDVAAMRGEREACSSYLAQLPSPMFWNGWDTTACLRGRLHLGLGDPETVSAVIEAGVDLDAPASFYVCTSVFDLAEAYVRLGRPAAAAETLERIAPGVTQAWGVAAMARSRGLLDEDFDASFQESIKGFGELSMVFEEAHSRFCYGERLRREGRRVEAREQLRAGLASFERLHSQSWSDRTRDELRAAGETLPVRPDSGAAKRLTPQELNVASAVAAGATNREVAARLFLSVKTVEAHLHRVFRKLEIDSRDQLAGILTPEPPPTGDVTPGEGLVPQQQMASGAAPERLRPSG